MQAAYGARPLQWLLDNAPVDDRWCLIHATQMTTEETLKRFAGTKRCCRALPDHRSQSRRRHFRWGSLSRGRWIFGIGSDSNIRIGLKGELCQLDYSQRLRDHSRAALASDTKSTGRRLLEGAAKGGAQASARGSGVIEIGAYADLLALDGSIIDFISKKRDTLLDAWIFAGSEPAVRDVWSAGRHVVKDGRHVERDAIRARYATTIRSLGERI